jgi:hypothetical protein
MQYPERPRLTLWGMPDEANSIPKISGERLEGLEQWTSYRERPCHDITTKVKEKPLK